MAVYDELRSALRSALLEVFEDVRLEKTAEEGAEQIAEVFRDVFTEVLPHLGQIEALTPAYNQVIVGNGEQWVTADRCCDDGGITLPEAQAIFSPLDHGHAEYEAAGTMGGHLLDPDPHPDYTLASEVALSIDAAFSDHLAAENPHEITPGMIGAATASHTHATYQLVSQKGQANGYASLGSDGRVPASQLPQAAYASTTTTADAGPGAGAFNPFAGTTTSANVEARNVTFSGTTGEWTVDVSGVYEVSVVLPVAVSEAADVTISVGSYTLAGLAADTSLRAMHAVVLLSLEASESVGVTVQAGGTSLATVGAGATVNIRRIA